MLEEDPPVADEDVELPEDPLPLVPEPEAVEPAPSLPELLEPEPPLLLSPAPEAAEPAESELAEESLGLAPWERDPLPFWESVE